MAKYMFHISFYRSGLLCLTLFEIILLLMMLIFEASMLSQSHLKIQYVISFSKATMNLYFKKHICNLISKRSNSVKPLGLRMSS